MTDQITYHCFDQARLDLFWTFVCERQYIWQRRAVSAEPPPWTTDVTLQRERFTNVYRELDPGTQYAITTILEQPELRSDRVFNVMLYRLIGRAETHAAIGFQRRKSFNPDWLRQTLWEIRDTGGSPFTAAYMVSAYHSMGTNDKVENVARLFTQLNATFDDLMARIVGADDLPAIHLTLQSAYGFGRFLAYQVLVDLLYPLQVECGQPLLPFSHDDWAKAGPGAQRGIRMLVLPEVRYDELEVMRWLRVQQRGEFKRLGLEFPYLRAPSGQEIEISLANIQNCLCEFHKYVKIRDGTGRGRRKFDPIASSNERQLPLGFRNEG